MPPPSRAPLFTADTDTGEDGRFLLDELDNKSYHLFVSAQFGKQFTSEQYPAVQAGQTNLVTLRLEPPGQTNLVAPHPRP